MSALDRRVFLTSLAAGVAAASIPLGADREGAHEADRSQALEMDGALAAPAFSPLPLGSIRPEGWLGRQLRIQADGLTGHLDEFWPDVADSQWFGGSAEGWERAPYWLDGAIPLAWTLDDAPLKARITAHVNFVLDHQRADGWYGPYPQDAAAKRYDLWAILLANKMLAQYHEATGDPRALRAVERSLRAMRAGLDRTPLYDWGKFRWFEGLVSVFYVYERTRAPWLLDLARTLRSQGVDYEALFARDDLAVPTPRRGLWTWAKHGVNTAMALKAGALSWRLDRRVRDRAWPAQMIAFLDRYHGQASGMFAADECLSGRNPVQGTELCAVVEYLYSLETLFSVFGDPAFGDRLEKIAFNALPAALAPDAWSHQYDQQVNQVQCTINPDHRWSTNGPDSNLFGLEPNYGCCTSNLHQGWPKFLAHLWMAAPDEGIVAAAYAPSRAVFTSHGVPVRLSMETDYPFRDAVMLVVEPERPARFPVLLRVPAWAEGATARIAGGPVTPLLPGTLHRLDREWRGRTEIAIRFPMRPSTTERYNGAIAIERGPLVYSLKLGETWSRVNADKPHRELPHGDFEVRPATPWNYGLVVRREGTVEDLTFQERPVGDAPFSPGGAGTVATARARRIASWRLDAGWAGEIAPDDAKLADASHRASSAPDESVTLIPYGCTNLRITEFPKLT